MSRHYRTFLHIYQPVAWKKWAILSPSETSVIDVKTISFRSVKLQCAVHPEISWVACCGISIIKNESKTSNVRHVWRDTLFFKNKKPPVPPRNNNANHSRSSARMIFRIFQSIPKSDSTTWMWSASSWIQPRKWSQSCSNDAFIIFKFKKQCPCLTLSIVIS